MTEEQREIMSRHFRKYGQPADTCDDRVNVWLISPEAIDDVQNAAHYDGHAAGYIKRLEAEIDFLKVYRLAMAERYQKLATTPTTPVIELKRDRRFDGKVFYRLTLYSRRCTDGKLVKQSDDINQTFEGKERHKAIAAFNAYLKSHPGIEAIKAIEKSKWER